MSTKPSSRRINNTSNLIEDVGVHSSSSTTVAASPTVVVLRRSSITGQATTQRGAIGNPVKDTTNETNFNDNAKPNHQDVPYIDENVTHSPLRITSSEEDNDNDDNDIAIIHALTHCRRPTTISGLTSCAKGQTEQSRTLLVQQTGRQAKPQSASSSKRQQVVVDCRDATAPIRRKTTPDDYNDLLADVNDGDDDAMAADDISSREHQPRSTERRPTTTTAAHSRTPANCQNGKFTQWCVEWIHLAHTHCMFVSVC